jgi:hypothetical protein
VNPGFARLVVESARTIGPRSILRLTRGYFPPSPRGLPRDREGAIATFVRDIVAPALPCCSTPAFFAPSDLGEARVSVG